jgi:hypothetical protein
MIYHKKTYIDERIILDQGIDGYTAPSWIVSINTHVFFENRTF